MSDDFFGSLDKRLSALSAKHDAASAEKEANRAFSERAIRDMHPIAKRYAGELGKRGIGVRVKGDERSLRFEMRWADGAEHGLSIYPDSETGALKLTRNSTDHSNGQKFSSSEIYAEKEWDASLFEGALEREIEDYIAYSEKHRGIA